MIVLCTTLQLYNFNVDRHDVRAHVSTNLRGPSSSGVPITICPRCDSNSSIPFVCYFVLQTKRLPRVPTLRNKPSQLGTTRKPETFQLGIWYKAQASIASKTGVHTELPIRPLGRSTTHSQPWSHGTSFVFWVTPLTWAQYVFCSGPYTKTKALRVLAIDRTEDSF